MVLTTMSLEGFGLAGLVLWRDRRVGVEELPGEEEGQSDYDEGDEVHEEDVEDGAVVEGDGGVDGEPEEERGDGGVISPFFSAFEGDVSDKGLEKKTPRYRAPQWTQDEGLEFLYVLGHFGGLPEGLCKLAVVQLKQDCLVKRRRRNPKDNEEYARDD